MAEKQLTVQIIHNKFNRPKGKGVNCNEKEGMTQQQFRDECDVNNIVNRFTKTGTWGSSLRRSTQQPMFGDFTNMFDFQTALDRINDAKNQFEELPANIRARFNNEPASLIDFINREENYDEAVILGLRNPKEEKIIDTTPPEAKK